MDILAQLLRIKVRDDLREDTRRAILDSPDNAEQDAAGDAAPGAILGPRLAFERLFPCDRRVTQGAGWQASALGAAPSAQPREGEAPQDRFIFVAQNDFTSARPVL